MSGNSTKHHGHQYAPDGVTTAPGDVTMLTATPTGEQPTTVCYTLIAPSGRTLWLTRHGTGDALSWTILASDHGCTFEWIDDALAWLLTAPELAPDDRVVSGLLTALV